MDFLKKNWVKLIFSVIFLAGLIVACLGMFSAIGVTSAEGFDLMPKVSAGAIKSGIFTNLAIVIAFAGALAIIVIKMLEKGKKIIPFISLAIGVLALIMFIIAIVNAKDYLKALKDTADAAKAAGKDSLAYKGAKNSHVSVIYDTVINIFVFACLPIVYGLKKLFKPCCKGNH